MLPPPLSSVALDRPALRQKPRLLPQPREGWTRRHSQRVTAMAVEIGREMAVSEAGIRLLNHGGQLHDIGKLGVPSAVLDKPGRLTRAEQELIKDHALIGERLLAAIPGLERVAPMVGQHHEFFNGKGYPRGLRGEEIDFFARILAVADTWDALRSPRPYRDPLPDRRVVRYIVERAGVQFDPTVVEVFTRLVASRRARPKRSANRRSVAGLPIYRRA